MRTENCFHKHTKCSKDFIIILYVCFSLVNDLIWLPCSIEWFVSDSCVIYMEWLIFMAWFIWIDSSRTVMSEVTDVYLTWNSSRDTNHSRNDDDDYPYPSQYSWQHIVVSSVVVSIIMIIIVVGNVLVVVAIAVDRHLKSVQNWFIASLALSDLLVGLFIMPLSLAYEMMGYWTFGDVMCQLWLSTDVLLCTASILNLVLISLDRYWSITRSIDYVRGRTKTRAAGMIAVVWLLSMIICLPPLFGWKQPQPTTETGLPLCVLSEEPGYVMYSIIGSFYMPLIVMVIVYLKIYTVARGHARRSYFKPTPSNCSLKERRHGNGTRSALTADVTNSNVMVTFNNKKVIYNTSPIKEISSDLSNFQNIQEPSRDGADQIEEMNNYLLTVDRPVSETEKLTNDVIMTNDERYTNDINCQAEIEAGSRLNGGGTVLNSSIQIEIPPDDDCETRRNSLECPESREYSRLSSRWRSNMVGSGGMLLIIDDASLKPDPGVSLLSASPAFCGSCVPIGHFQKSRSKQDLTLKLDHGNTTSTEAQLKPNSTAIFPDKVSDFRANESSSSTSSFKIKFSFRKRKPTFDNNSPTKYTEHEKTRRKVARAKERRATLVLGIVMASFIGCWLPSFPCTRSRWSPKFPFQNWYSRWSSGWGTSTPPSTPSSTRYSIGNSVKLSSDFFSSAVGVTNRSPSPLRSDTRPSPDPDVRKCSCRVTITQNTCHSSMVQPHIVWNSPCYMKFSVSYIRY